MGSLFQRNRNGYGNLVLKSCFLEEVVVATYSDRGWMTKQIKGKVGGDQGRILTKTVSVLSSLLSFWPRIGIVSDSGKRVRRMAVPLQIYSQTSCSVLQK